MATHTLTLNETLRQFTARRRRNVWLLALIRTLWVLAAAFLAFVYLDVLLLLPDRARLVMDAAVLVGVVVISLVTYRRWTRSRSEARMIARMVEEGNPDLGNDLINAIDFEETLAAGTPLPFSTELMGHEISIAANKIAHVRSMAPLKPAALGRELRALLALVALCAVLGVAFPRVYAAVIPRYLDPFGDHPPFSLTELNVTPAGTTVEYGENLIVTVSATGRKPGGMVLAIESAAREPIAELTMLDRGDGTWFQTIENVREDLVYHARIDRGRSHRYPLTLSKIPRIDSATVLYTYPEYTRLEPKLRQLPPTDAKLAAYAGTTAALSLTSNRPLSGGPLTVNDAAIEMQPLADNHTAGGSFEMDAPGVVTARLVDIEGNASTAAFNAALEIVPDEKPRIDVTSPGRHAFATPDAKVPVVIEAEDDLGIANVSLFRNLNQSSDMKKALFDGEAATKLFSKDVVLDMADLGVRPGDVIDYYATVTDTLPSTPQTAATPAFQIAIVSTQDYQNFMQEQMTAEDLTDKYQAMLDEIEALAEAQSAVEETIRALQEKLESGAPLSESERAQLSDAMEQQAALAQEAAALAEKMREQANTPGVFDIEKEYNESLKKIAETLDQAQQHMQAGQESLAQASGAQNAEEQKQAMQGAASQAREALETLGKGQQEFDEQIQQANKELEDAYHLMSDVEMFKQLYTAQNDLERQTRSLKNLKSPGLDEQVRMKELAEAQEQIRGALSELKDNLREHAKDVEEKHPQIAEDALEIADEIESREIASIMESGAQHLGETKAPEGHADVQHAREEMEAMISFCESMAGNAAGEFRLQISMSKNPGNTLGQLSKSLGSGAARGQFGYGGQGSSGMASSTTAFNMYGNDAFSRKPDKESSHSARRMHDAQADAEGEGTISGNIEELTTSDREAGEYEGEGGERFIEEYRPMIQAYFDGLAREDG